jgi:very-short-patch-repair endonuclease
VVDVLIPAAVQRRDCGFARLRRTRRLPDRACSDGDIRFATVDRAVADAARALNNPREVTAMVAAAVQRRRSTILLLSAELAAGPVRGSALLRHALAEVSSGIRSIAEADFRRLIQRAGLPLPMFNARLYEGQYLLAVVDAWWPEAGVVGEVDSREWHLAPEDWERTMLRHAELSAHGLVVLHFSPRQLRNEPDRVVATLRATLAAAATTRRRPPGLRAFPASG